MGSVLEFPMGSYRNKELTVKYSKIIEKQKMMQVPESEMAPAAVTERC